MPKPMKSYIAQLEKDLAYEADSAARKRDEEFWMQEIAKDEPMYTDFAGTGTASHIKDSENQNPEQRWAGHIKKSGSFHFGLFNLKKRLRCVL